MENIYIESTESTPEVHFDFAKNELLIKGESYPENVTKFYGPLFEKLSTYLEAETEREITVTLELVYFNSSSVKVIMNLFDMLETAATAGNKVHIIWCYQEDDETIEEFGEEFSEDLEHAKFTMKAL